MDLLSNLNNAQWKNASRNQVNGLKKYIIVRSKALQKGQFEVDCREDIEDGVMEKTILEGVTSKSNPLQAVRNVELKVAGGKIIAINLDDDCVVRKWLQASL